jgi:HPt (histidine-containing phosphotransfer) domain-containing protein
MQFVLVVDVMGDRLGAAAGQGAEGVVGLKGLQGRHAFVAKLAGIALASQAESPARLRDAAGQRNFDAIAFTAHSIKGMSANFSASRLRDFAAETEAAARARRDDAGPMALRLADLMDEFLAALSARMGEASGSASSAS